MSASDAGKAEAPRTRGRCRVAQGSPPFCPTRPSQRCCHGGCAVLGEPHAARARAVDATLILTPGGRRERSRCRRPGPRPEAAGSSRAPASRHCSQVCVSSSVSNLPCFLLSRHWPLGRGPRGRLGVLPPSRGPLRHIYNEVPSQGWVGEDIRGPSTGPGTESGSRVSHRGRGVEVLHRHVVTKAGGW